MRRTPSKLARRTLAPPLFIKDVLDDTDVFNFGQEISSKHGSRTMLALLARSRGEATRAMFQLIVCDPSKADEIASWQNEIIRHNDLCLWLRETWNDAEEILAQLNQEEIGDLTSEIIDPSTRQEYPDA